MNLLTLIQLGMRVQAGLDMLLKYNIPQTIRGIKYKGMVFQAVISQEPLPGDRSELVLRSAVVDAVTDLLGSISDLNNRAEAASKGDTKRQLGLLYSNFESAVETLKMRVEMLP